MSAFLFLTFSPPYIFRERERERERGLSLSGDLLKH